MKIIVELEELQHIAAHLEMYADLLDYVDETDIDDVEGYAAEIKEGAAALRRVGDEAEPVKGKK